MTTTMQREFSVFEYAQEIHIDAPRELVFEHVTTKPGDWYPSRFSPGSTVTAEPRVGGRIFEDLGDGQGWLWDICTAYVRPQVARYESPWGFAGPVSILVGYVFEEQDGGTLLKVKHTIVGDIPPEALTDYEAHIKPLGEMLTSYFAKIAS